MRHLISANNSSVAKNISYRLPAHTIILGRGENHCLLRIGAETYCRCKRQFPVACTVRKPKELSLIKTGLVSRHIEFSKIKFMHNFHFKKLPLSFANTWMTNIERNPERDLRNANDLYIPPHRVELVKRLPHSRNPRILRLVINLTPGNTCILKN
jgi:hypothetical protein